jgi:hypothetical protein
VTFNGIAKACAKAAGAPEPEIINYNPKVGVCCSLLQPPLLLLNSWLTMQRVAGTVMIQCTACPCSFFHSHRPNLSNTSQDFDFGKEKPFPLRDQHFFTSIDKASTWPVVAGPDKHAIVVVLGYMPDCLMQVCGDGGQFCPWAPMPPALQNVNHRYAFILCLQAMADLDWKPEFSLLDGLKDSYEKDFGRGTFRKAADFSKDDMVSGTWWQAVALSQRCFVR